MFVILHSSMTLLDPTNKWHSRTICLLSKCSILLSYRSIITVYWDNHLSERKNDKCIVPCCEFMVIINNKYSNTCLNWTPLGYWPRHLWKISRLLILSEKIPLQLVDPIVIDDILWIYYTWKWQTSWTVNWYVYK